MYVLKKLMLFLRKRTTMKFKKGFIYFTIIFLMAVPFSTMAQVEPGCNPDEPCPIDSNLYFLIAGAIIIAAKKTYDYKKKQVII